MRESAVEARFRKRVRELGGLTWKLVSAEAGVPDRIVMHDGRVYLVELKAVGGRLSELQRLCHQRCADRGVVVHVLTGPTEVDRWCERLALGAV